MLLSSFLVSGLAYAEASKAGKDETTIAWAIEPRFDDAGDFAVNGLAMVNVGTKRTLWNSEGGRYGYIRMPSK